MVENLDDGEKLLLKLKKSFLRGSHDVTIESTDVTHMTWDWQQNFLDSTINSALFQKYPLNRLYIKIFLKKIIDCLEGIQDIHDDFYSELCGTMYNNEANDDFCYRHYMISKKVDIITIKETNKMVMNGTTGMKTWEAALMLADWALCHKEIFANKTILELGSGVGFTGITIAKLCLPKSIYLTDCHPDVMRAISDNITINFPKSDIIEMQDTILFRDEQRIVGAMPLDWNSIEELSSEDIIPDVVIGADIVYDPSILQPLCDVLRTLFCRNKYLQVYITSVIRNEDTFGSFLKCLDAMDFTYRKLILNKSVFIDWDQSIQKCMLQIEMKKNF